MRRALLRLLFVLALPVALVAVWWAASDGSTNPFWPPLRTILKSFPEVWTRDRLRTDVLPSVLRLAAGYATGAVVGVALGTVIGSYRRVRAVCEPVLEFLRTVPPPVLVLLSGGMQQRVAIARALAYEPDVLLMDEPFAAVDAQTRADLEDLVRGLWRERGITILFVTHDIDEAVYLGERVVVLSASPTVVQEQLKVDLPAERDQLHTRVAPRFAELRTHVYEQIQAAKRGAAKDAVTGSDTPPPH